MHGAVIEGAENGNAVGGGTVGGSALTSGVEEGVGIVHLGGRHEATEHITGHLAEVNQVELVVSSLGGEVLAGDLLASGAGLLDNPLDDSVGSAATSVFLLLAIAESGINLRNRTYTNQIRVGKPFTSKRSARALFSVASTLAT